ncbi:MAG: substrate-binding domain-containing protein [Shewanella sp.]|uniref:substrate-binding domain-containing protein n=1 Tax=Shewanella sp. SNU WT4 TaxID=2590015 RepID=UPI00112AEE19|nr:substrate-binding domain-containing protein [Shewanella sp. SNU WT4]QDF65367.1 LacI family DNA-binding transcriptional regulator [Shewanella sp. SNU WT4]
MATIKDIAKLAQVSTSTVSHVLNNTRFVSDEVKERVQAAVKELNYAPSALARSLKTKHTRTFGMLVTTSTNPFFAEVVKGVESHCYQHGYSLMLCNTEGDAERIRFNLSTLLQKQVDGLLLMCSEAEAQAFAQLSSQPNLPTVVMDWGPTNFQCDKIQDNSRQGGYLATRYLIEQGHQLIGCVTGPLDKLPSQQRLAGFTDAMNEAKLSIKPEWQVSGNFECDGGAAAFADLIKAPNLPTAMFVGNDMMAMGFMHAAYNAGLNIPEQLSVIGYDDIELARYLTPALTTIHQPKQQLGHTAVEVLLARLDNPGSSKTIQLEPSLVVRDSVKKINP